MNEPNNLPSRRLHALQTALFLIALAIILFLEVMLGRYVHFDP